MEEDQVVPHTPEEETNYDLTMPIPPTPVSANDELFEDEEDPIKNKEQHDEEFGGVPADSSPYPDSSSHQDLVDTREEDPSKLESYLEMLSQLHPSSS